MSIYLTSELVTDAVLAEQPTLEQLEIKLAREQLIALIGEFEQRVWFAGLQTYVHKATQQGHRCEAAEHIDILLYAIMDCVVITFRDMRTWHDLTLITNEDATKSTMGMQSINATPEEAEQFLKGSIRLAEHGALHFRPYAGTTLI